MSGLLYMYVCDMTDQDLSNMQSVLVMFLYETRGRTSIPIVTRGRTSIPIVTRGRTAPMYDMG
jgi:hypothetical protein